MSHNYGLRAAHQQLDSDGVDIDDAASTIGARSSPPAPELPEIDFPEDIAFADLGSDYLPDENSDEDGDYNPANARAPKRSDDEKCIEILQFMKEKIKRFSLPLLLNTLFTSDNSYIKNTTNMYLAQNGACHLLEMVVGDRWKQDEQLCDCILDKAAAICGREASWLTDQASNGPNYLDAQFLRVKATDVRVDMLKSFRIHDLPFASGRGSRSALDILARLLLAE